MTKSKFVLSYLLCCLALSVFVTTPVSAQLQKDRSSKRANLPTTENVSAPVVEKRGQNQRTELPPRSNKKSEAGDPKGAKEPASSDGSEFIIPKGASPQELLEMANKLLNSERNFKTEAEYNAWIAKMIETVYEIASNVLTMNVDNELYVKAAGLKGEMLYYRVWSNPEVYAHYEKFIRALQKDKRLMETKEGQNVIDNQLASFLHESCVRTVQTNGSADDLKKYVDEFQELVMRNPDFVKMIPDIVYPVNELSITKKDPKMLKNIFFQFASAMKKSDNKTLKDAASGLEGILRFAELEGKPMQIVGTTADGEKFNSASVKGKVYLVNFWATWVTPCVAQYPELLALYIQYKDQGFEIIGYNMDEKLDQFKDYVASKNVPWPNISETMSTENKQPSLSEFYGITTIPTLILVGKDGKVIENDIDLEQLKAKLAELYK